MRQKLKLKGFSLFSMAFQSLSVRFAVCCRSRQVWIPLPFLIFVFFFSNKFKLLIMPRTTVNHAARKAMKITLMIFSEWIFFFAISEFDIMFPLLFSTINDDLKQIYSFLKKKMPKKFQLIFVLIFFHEIFLLLLNF